MIIIPKSECEEVFLDFLAERCVCPAALQFSPIEQQDI